MTVQIVEQIEYFSPEELETLEFLPEELENIESELYPDLESISIEEVARDLEAFFEEDIEEAQLERRRRRRRRRRRGSRRNIKPDISKFDLKGSVTVKPLKTVHGPEFNKCLKQAGWREARNAHILKRLKQRGPSVGINTLADFAREVRQGRTERNKSGGWRRFLNITSNKGKKPFVVFRDDRTPGTFVTLSF